MTYMASATSKREQVTTVGRMLSSETRVRILELLRERCLCVNAIAHRLGISQAAVSQHLRLLKEAGLVRPERRGYYVHYSLSTEPLLGLAAQLRELAGGRG